MLCWNSIIKQEYQWKYGDEIERVVNHTCSDDFDGAYMAALMAGRPAQRCNWLQSYEETRKKQNNK